METQETNEATQDFLENIDILGSQDGEGVEKDWENNTEEVKEVEPKPTEKTEKKEEITESESETDIDKLFNFTTEDDSGNKTLDTEKAFKFFETKDVTVEQPVVEPEPIKKNEVPYEDTLKQNLTYGLDRVKEYVKAGHDYETALLLATRDIDDGLEKHALKKEVQEAVESVKREKAAIREQAALESARPKSTANLSESVRNHGWGTSDKLTAALLHKDLGGAMFETLFRWANPGKKFKSAQEYSEALGDYFIKATSDKHTLLALEEFARARIFMRNKPALVDKIRNTKEKVNKENKEANISGDQARHRNEPTTRNESDAAKWLKNLGFN